MNEFIDRLINTTAGWLASIGPDSRVVHSTRVRLARNFEKISFPRPSGSDIGVVERIKEEAKRIHSESFSLKKMTIIDFDLGGVTMLDREFLVERHLISREFSAGTGKLLILDDNETVSIMINEEDHFRFQVLRSGLDAIEGWRVLRTIERDVDKHANFAFKPPYGYLTACPTNLGTGLRVSALCHLPALLELKEVQGVFEAASRVGIAVRGFYGEGSAPIGNFFQISNRTTLGQTEEEIVNQVENAIRKIAEHELKAREKLIQADRVRIEDRFYRALGILSSSRMMTSAELMNLLSIVRIGIDLGIDSKPPVSLLNEIQIGAQPSHLQKRIRPLEPRERDIERANYVRKKIKEM